MSKIKVGINGFGRIGRMVTRSILSKYSDKIDIVGVNDLTDTATLAHLFKYDSTQGKYNGKVSVDGDKITIDNMSFSVTAERDPANLNWGDLGVDIVIESTGFFVDKESASKHIEAGAKKVIIPTSTGAAKAVGLVLPHLDGKLDGGAVRVPTPTGSLTDFVCEVEKETTAEEVNAAFKKAAEGSLKGILEYTDEPLVSTDIIGNEHSNIFDSDLTKVDGNLVKIIGWYDNEAGYSMRTADLILKLA